MKAILKEMHLRNFKGVRDKIYNFSEISIIRGTNGVGKTTINDAYTWCLFGKDSKGRTDFGIKRRNSDNDVIHGLEYAVEVVFNIDGQEKRFERVLTEKWTKNKGDYNKTLTGHTSAYYIDKVRCSTKTEYDIAVKQIASEDLMRILTDVTYFMSLQDKDKKSYLLRMAYETNDIHEAIRQATKDVTSKHQEFASFIDTINGIESEEHLANIRKKIKLINDELDDIPNYIKAKEELVPDKKDWTSIQEKLDTLNKELNDVLSQKAKVCSNTVIDNLNDKARNIKMSIADAQIELTKQKTKALQDCNVKNSFTNNDIANIKSKIAGANGRIEMAQATIQKDEIKAQKLEAELNNLRAEYKDIKAGSIEFTEEELICPTCKRPFEKEDLISTKLSLNVSTGKQKKILYTNYIEEIELLKSQVSDAQKEIDVCNKEIEEKQKNLINPADVLANNYECLCLEEKIVGLQRELSETENAIKENNVAVQAENPYKEQEDSLNSEIKRLSEELAGKQYYDIAIQQIEELHKTQKEKVNQLADLEREEETILSFIKERDCEILTKVNGLFKFVTWSFVSEQLNGNEKLCCNCFVEGMPYQERNRSAQINAGLDIINALSRSENISLPIFIDNAESVVNFIDTISQIILLVVDKNYDKLTIE